MWHICYLVNVVQRLVTISILPGVHKLHIQWHDIRQICKTVHQLHSMALVQAKAWEADSGNKGNHEGFPLCRVIEGNAKASVEDKVDSDIGGAAGAITITNVALIQYSTSAADSLLIPDCGAASALRIH